LDFLRSTFPAHLDLSGKKIAVDCANGAAYRIAPRLLELLGARVFPLGIKPNGSNINRGFGALETQAMQKEVRRRGCDYGVSFDGDADRAILADRSGVLCDGDVILSMAATDLRSRGLLNRNKVVLTVMANYGLIQFFKEQGIGVEIVPVGDRNVTEAIERENLSLGGEASGHIVFRRFGPTGDGMLTALQTLSILAGSGKPLSYFRKQYRTYPQILRNIRTENRVPLEDLPEMQKCIRECERHLRGKGRVFVRYSGTEPLIRILVEGPELVAVRRLSEKIAVTFNREIRTYGHKTGR
jgi:phosphoglucosamine mutase